MKAVRWVVLAMAVALVAGACSSGQAKATTVLHVIMTDDWVTAPYNDAVREFERTHPNVRVNTDKGPIKSMTDAVRAGISAGSPPDVVQGHAVTGAGQELADAVDDLWRKHNLTPGEYLQGSLEDVTWGGKRYGLPLDSNAMALLYNVDLFRQAGQSPPNASMTFGQFETLAKGLTSADGARRALVVPVDAWATFGWITANGGEMVKVGTDGKPTFTFDQPAVVDTLGYLQRLVQEGVAFGPTGPDARSVDAYGLFRSGATAMLATGSWDLAKILKDSPAGQYGVALMPSGLTGQTRGTAMGGSSLWIPKGAAHRDLAFDFMLVLTSDKYALRFAKEEGRLPVRPRVLADAYFQQSRLGVFVQQLDTAHVPILGALHDAAQAFDTALNQVFREQANPKTAMSAAQTRAVASVGSS